MEKRGLLIVAIVFVAIFSVWVFSSHSFISGNGVTGAITGMVAVSCTTDAQCGQEQYCLSFGGPGSCVNKQPNGGRCGLDKMCLSGICSGNVCVAVRPNTGTYLAACNAGNTCNQGLTCVSNVCRKADGQTCTAVQDGLASTECASWNCGLSADRSRSVCLPKCISADAECPQNPAMYCAQVSLGGKGCRYKKDNGQECGTSIGWGNNQCKSGDCSKTDEKLSQLDIYRCREVAQPQSQTPSCTTHDQCGAGKFCFSIMGPGSCINKVANGGSCLGMGAAACILGICSSNVCVAELPQTGTYLAVCNAGGTCNADLTCVSNVCRKAVNQQCTAVQEGLASTMCASWNCGPSADGRSSVCLPKCPNGTDAECLQDPAMYCARGIGGPLGCRYKKDNGQECGTSFGWSHTQCKTGNCAKTNEKRGQLDIYKCSEGAPALTQAQLLEQQLGPQCDPNNPNYCSADKKCSEKYYGFGKRCFIKVNQHCEVLQGELTNYQSLCEYSAICDNNVCKGDSLFRCNDNNQCKTGMTCLPSVQGSARVCGVPREATNLPDGADCTTNNQCVSRNCVSVMGLGTCRPLGQGLYANQEVATSYDVLRLSSDTNAHGALASNTNYPVPVRIPVNLLLQPPANPRDCGNTDQHLVLRLSSDTNAHAAVKTFTQYTTKVCHAALSQCELSQNQCAGGKTAIIKLSGESNAHLSLVDQPGYTNVVCCTIMQQEVQVTPAEQPPVRGGEGQPCIVEQNNQCDATLVCQASTCVREQPAGQPQAQQGGLNQQCRAADPKCDANLECKENICQPKVFAGESPSQCSVPELKQQLIQTYGDADQDNVPDGFCDQCPGTPADKRANVNAVGCAPQDTSKPSRGTLKCEDMDGIYCGSNSCAQGIAMPVNNDPLRMGGICCVPDQSGSTPTQPLCRSEQPPASLGAQVGEVREGPCNDPDGDGLGTKQYYDQNNNLIGEPQSCTTIPREQVVTEPVPFYSLFSSILTLVLLVGFYLSRKNKLNKN